MQPNDSPNVSKGFIEDPAKARSRRAAGWGNLATRAWTLMRCNVRSWCMQPIGAKSDAKGCIRQRTKTFPAPKGAKPQAADGVGFLHPENAPETRNTTPEIILPELVARADFARLQCEVDAGSRQVRGLSPDSLGSFDASNTARSRGCIQSAGGRPNRSGRTGR